jgi:hypothetical protein
MHIFCFPFNHHQHLPTYTIQQHMRSQAAEQARKEALQTRMLGNIPPQNAH